ncbi:hypothetical protein [Rhizobium herbae]
MTERISIAWKTSISRIMMRPDTAMSSIRTTDVTIHAAAFAIDGLLSMRHVLSSSSGGSGWTRIAVY